MNDKTNYKPKDNKANPNDENEVSFSNDQLGENSTEYIDDKTRNNCGCNKNKNK